MNHAVRRTVGPSAEHIGVSRRQTPKRRRTDRARGGASPLQFDLAALARGRSSAGPTRPAHHDPGDLATGPLTGTLVLGPAG